MAKKTTAAVAEVVNPEVQLVQREGSAIVAFLSGKLEAFLLKARELEVRALEAKANARTLTQPTNADQDALLKDTVRIWKSDIKETEDHWEICQLLGRFHKRFTSRRGVAVDALKDAVQIGTNLHQQFVNAEERRIREEAEAKRRAEEERAAAERKKELDDLEAQALAKESALEGLSEREQKFVDAYVANGGRGLDAARVAGYRDPVAQGERLLKSAKVKAAITAKHEAEALRQERAAVAAAPLETREVVVESQADTKGDRGNHKAIVVDARAFIAAVVAGAHGIPLDTLTFDQSALNEYAKKIGPLIERWPGIRYSKTTTIV